MQKRANKPQNAPRRGNAAHLIAFFRKIVYNIRDTKVSHADMAKLADAQDLESCGQPCRFKSCYPHHYEWPLRGHNDKRQISLTGLPFVVFYIRLSYFFVLWYNLGIVEPLCSSGHGFPFTGEMFYY